MSGSPLVAVTRPMRMTMWSSTSRIRILRDSAAMGEGGSRYLHRHAHGGAMPRRALDLQLAADLAGTATQSPQAKVPEAAGQHLIRDKTIAIVRDLQADAARLIGEGDDDGPGG